MNLWKFMHMSTISSGHIQRESGLDSPQEAMELAQVRFVIPGSFGELEWTPEKVGASKDGDLVVIVSPKWNRTRVLFAVGVLAVVAVLIAVGCGIAYDLGYQSGQTSILNERQLPTL